MQTLLISSNELSWHNMSPSVYRGGLSTLWLEECIEKHINNLEPNKSQARTVEAGHQGWHVAKNTFLLEGVLQRSLTSIVSEGLRRKQYMEC